MENPMRKKQSKLKTKIGSKKSDRKNQVAGEYVFPPPDIFATDAQTRILKGNKNKKSRELKIEGINIVLGPIVTLYELFPSDESSTIKFTAFLESFAKTHFLRGTRIINPIPRKGTIGIEIPNIAPSTVHLKTLLSSTEFLNNKAKLQLLLGRTTLGNICLEDLVKMPHLLIAGSDGSDVIRCIHNFITGLLFYIHPSNVKFVIIDRTFSDLKIYDQLKNHFLATSPDSDEVIVTTLQNAKRISNSLEKEMENRYKLLTESGVRDITGYHKRFGEHKMPYIIVIINDLSALLDSIGKSIARLAMLARAVGIHLIVGTQHPTHDVLTDVIRSSIPARIAFQVSSKSESKCIINKIGAEDLLGNGDMLYLRSGEIKPVRIPCPIISIPEIEQLIKHITAQKGCGPYQFPTIVGSTRTKKDNKVSDRDEYFEEAARLVVRHQKGSVTLIQRRLKVGYARAARIIDQMEAAGVVGPFDGSSARQVLITNEDQLDALLKKIP
jgi:S-DNA-T family DNA segregation ATPase FtsK/SpoIIIE